MSFGRTVFFGTLTWVSLITTLQVYSNWGTTQKSFRIGFLPVT
jgi:hypothetical protein